MQTKLSETKEELNYAIEQAKKQREISVSELAGYPELVFIAFAYMGFILVSYRVFKISKEFGFKEEGREIEHIIKGKKKK